MLSYSITIQHEMFQSHMLSSTAFDSHIDSLNLTTCAPSVILQACLKLIAYVLCLGVGSLSIRVLHGLDLSHKIFSCYVS